MIARRYLCVDARSCAPLCGLVRLWPVFDGESGETNASILKNGDFGTQLACLGSASLNPMFVFDAIGLDAGDGLGLARHL